ncbi:hypothetical protein LTR17_009290 [Elasticomyces elasticus]|nr:hypothetical protein LTR17_009290 [Elasticomyces elasticus]
MADLPLAAKQAFWSTSPKHTVPSTSQVANMLELSGTNDVALGAGENTSVHDQSAAKSPKSTSSASTEIISQSDKALPLTAENQETRRTASSVSRPTSKPALKIGGQRRNQPKRPKRAGQTVTAEEAAVQRQLELDRTRDPARVMQQARGRQGSSAIDAHPGPALLIQRATRYDAEARSVEQRAQHDLVARLRFQRQSSRPEQTRRVDSDVFPAVDRPPRPISDGMGVPVVARTHFPTLAEVRNAISASGIRVSELQRRFLHQVENRQDDFQELVFQVGTVSAVTSMIEPWPLLYTHSVDDLHMPTIAQDATTSMWSWRSMRSWWPPVTAIAAQDSIDLLRQEAQTRSEVKDAEPAKFAESDNDQVGDSSTELDMFSDKNAIQGNVAGNKDYMAHDAATTALNGKPNQAHTIEGTAMKPIVNEPSSPSALLLRAHTCAEERSSSGRASGVEQWQEIERIDDDDKPHDELVRSPYEDMGTAHESGMLDSALAMPVPVEEADELQRLGMLTTIDQSRELAIARDQSTIVTDSLSAMPTEQTEDGHQLETQGAAVPRTGLQREEVADVVSTPLDASEAAHFDPGDGPSEQSLLKAAQSEQPDNGDVLTDHEPTLAPEPAVKDTDEDEKDSDDLSSLEGVVNTLPDPQQSIRNGLANEGWGSGVLQRGLGRIASDSRLVSMEVGVLVCELVVLGVLYVMCRDSTNY